MEYDVHPIDALPPSEIAEQLQLLCRGIYGQVWMAQPAGLLEPDPPVQAPTELLALPDGLPANAMAVVVAKVLFVHSRRLIHLVATEKGAVLVVYHLRRDPEDNLVIVTRTTAEILDEESLAALYRGPFLIPLLHQAAEAYHQAWQQTLSPCGGPIDIPVVTKRL